MKPSTPIARNSHNTLASRTPHAHAHALPVRHVVLHQNALPTSNGLGLIHDLRQSGSLFQRSASQEQQLQQQRHHNTAAKNQRRATNSEYYPDTFHHQTVVEMNMAGV
mmetsp:Transcript_20177/g.57289  ORF Transcript_20177/g.57289 Transcript_20177/m.57289 type:complete len:108 (+) Transcript_20177:526-849(+)